MSDVQVGFIGIGTMGWPMAKNLIKGGHAIGVHDADTGRVTRFIAEEPTARQANGAAGLAQSSNVLVTMLPTGAIVREVMHDILAAKAFQPGTIVIDMSSSEPAGTRALAATLKEAGVTLVDAPVSGGVTGAQAGTLALMIGGDDDAAVERVKPVLQSMGAKLFRTGASGSGHAMKCLNNFLASSNLRATTEAMSIGMQFGLDPKQMVEVFNASSGKNLATEGLIPGQILSGKFNMGFTVGLMAKDVGIAAGLANELGVYAPGVVLTHHALTNAREALGFGADLTNAYKHWTRDVTARGKS
jgi:3-hydroxyisobutyrate dehydrogenase